MPITLQCPCGKTLQVDDQYLGKKTKCPACGNILLVEERAQPGIPSEPPQKLPTSASEAAPPSDRTEPARSIVSWLAAGGCGCVGLVLCIAFTGAGTWYFGPKPADSM